MLFLYVRERGFQIRKHQHGWCWCAPVRRANMCISTNNYYVSEQFKLTMVVYCM